MISLSARLQEDEAWKKIRKLAAECIKSSDGERPELLWVKRRYEAVPGPERTLHWERRGRLEQLAEQYRL